MLNDFIIKALNADDDVEVNQLPKLFSKALTTNFPLKSVFSNRFWKTHSGSRLTSITIRHVVKGQLVKTVAHLAIRPERLYPSHVQVLLPVIDPDYVQFAPQFRAMYSDILQRLSIRQNWKFLYFYGIAGLPGTELLDSNELGMSAASIWPGSYPGLDIGNTLASRFDATLYQKMLASSSTNQHELSEEVLFVPKKHKIACEYVYNQLGLKPQIVSSKKELDEKKYPIAALAADRRALQVRSYRLAGITLASVEPSLLPKAKQAIRELENSPARCKFIQINAYDPKAPEFCETLEDYGYKFSGVLPFHCGKQSIVYYSAPKHEMAIDTYTEDSSVLARYVQSNKEQEIQGLLQQTRNFQARA